MLLIRMSRKSPAFQATGVSYPLRGTKNILTILNTTTLNSNKGNCNISIMGLTNPKTTRLIFQSIAAKYFLIPTSNRKTGFGRYVANKCMTYTIKFLLSIPSFKSVCLASTLRPILSKLRT